MSEVVNLRSRYGEKNYLKLLQSTDNTESKTYVLKTSSGYVWESKCEGKLTINPIGGPRMTEGEKIPYTNLVIKSIYLVKGYGYTITVL